MALKPVRRVVPFGAMDVRELLIETMAHIRPAHALEHLTPDDAERRVPGANHSIAEIVAHMNFWASWFCGRCEGTDAPMVTSAATGWPAVAPGAWPELHAPVPDYAERAAALGADPGRLAAIAPAIEFPPLANFTIRDALVHMAPTTRTILGRSSSCGS